MGVVKQYGPVVGRILMGLLFLVFGLEKLMGFEGTAGYIAAKNLPLPQVLAALTILIEVGGGLLLIAGWKVRIVAAIIFLWLIPVTLSFHNYWTMAGMEAYVNKINFFKNLALMGAMLYVMAFGAGRCAVDKN